MARTWVLRTDTKGTGAQMVPIETVETGPSAPVEPVFVPRKPERPDEPEAPEPRAPHRFKIVDVMTRQTIIQDAGAREAVDALKDVRSVVDVDVYTWRDEEERWRRLTFGETRAMLQLARA